MARLPYPPLSAGSGKKRNPDGERESEIEGVGGGEADRQTDIQEETDRRDNRERDRQTERWTDRRTDGHKSATSCTHPLPPPATATAIAAAGGEHPRHPNRHGPPAEPLTRAALAERSHCHCADRRRRRRRRRRSKPVAAGLGGGGGGAVNGRRDVGGGDGHGLQKRGCNNHYIYI
jgi:hypothetical protein